MAANAPTTAVATKANFAKYPSILAIPAKLLAPPASPAADASSAAWLALADEAVSTLPTTLVNFAENWLRFPPEISLNPSSSALAIDSATAPPFMALDCSISIRRNNAICFLPSASRMLANASKASFSIPSLFRTSASCSLAILFVKSAAFRMAFCLSSLIFSNSPRTDSISFVPSPLFIALICD